VKKNKDKINLANAGLGAASHLCGLLFMSAIETDLTTIPFKGTADAMNALLGKQVDLLCDQTTNTTGQIKANSVKAYAVTSAARVASLPNLPTTAEAGLPALQVGVWHGIYAPKGTPKVAVDKLVAALQAGAKDPDFVRRMSDLGATIYSEDRMTPAAHATLPAGLWQASVVLTPPAESSERESASLPLPVAPDPVIAADPTLALAGIDLQRLAGPPRLRVRLFGRPQVRPEQAAQLALGNVTAMAARRTNASEVLEFDFPGSLAAGPAWLRLRVDGVDSLLVDKVAMPPRFDPAYQVTVPA